MEDTPKIFIAVVLAIVAVFFLYNLLTTELNSSNGGRLSLESAPPITASNGPNSVSLQVPAVDDLGNGVSTTLVVEKKPGKGGTLVDVNQLFFWVDTQNSIRTAKAVAEDYTHLNLSDVDLTYRIETNASAIGGPSAGAALAIATISVLENRALNPSVMITGTVNPDGSIGQVGGIEEKAKASKSSGATTFLVPEGQSSDNFYTTEKVCKRYGFIDYCNNEYVLKEVNVEKDVGIKVVEVSDIKEALKYFFA
jgi:uncharacterized protein